MAQIYFYKETAAPAVYTANSVYFIAPTGKDYLELHVTGSNASVVKKIPTESEIRSWIAAGGVGRSPLKVVDDIDARDAQRASASMFYVKDATKDTSVKRGGAFYIYDGTAFTKVAEAESMDLSLSWDDVKDKPNVTKQQIETTVTNTHTHANKTQLDKIGESNGILTYGGKAISTEWSKTEW